MNFFLVCVDLRHLRFLPVFCMLTCVCLCMCRSGQTGPRLDHRPDAGQVPDAGPAPVWPCGP